MRGFLILSGGLWFAAPKAAWKLRALLLAPFSTSVPVPAVSVLCLAR